MFKYFNSPLHVFRSTCTLCICSYKHRIPGYHPLHIYKLRFLCCSPGHKLFHSHLKTLVIKSKKNIINNIDYLSSKILYGDRVFRVTTFHLYCSQSFTSLYPLLNKTLNANNWDIWLCFVHIGQVFFKFSTS